MMTPATDIPRVRARRRIAARALAMVAVAVALAVFGCGSGDGVANKSIAEILGHQPTGEAQKIADSGTLVVGTDADYPPQSSIDPDTKELVGFDIDVAKRAGDLLGLKVEFVNPNWDAVAEGLDTQRFDVYIGSLPAGAGGNPAIAYSAPYYYSSAQLVIPKGETKIASADELQGKVVGVTAQTSYQAYLEKVGGIVVQVYTSDADALDALEAGMVNAVLLSDLTAGEALSGGKPIALSGKPYFYEPLAFGLKKDESDLKALFDSTIKTLRDDGTLTELSRHWYAMDATRPPDGVPSFDEVMKD
jgi:polar amino acid transport system substrate-binding protein